MPKLWNETIEAHRREVRDAIQEATAALVAEHGLRAVTMSQIAEKTGIGRATLYKYFPDVDAILQAWHHRQITGHLQHLAQVRDHAGEPGRRLEAVLEAYALIARKTRRHHDTELAAFLHRDEHLVRAQRQLHDLVRDLVAEGARAGDLRDDRQLLPDRPGRGRQPALPRRDRPARHRHPRRAAPPALTDPDPQQPGALPALSRESACPVLCGRHAVIREIHHTASRRS